MNEETKRGLCDPPERLYLFVGATDGDQSGSLWYTMGDGGAKHPVKERAVLGRITEIQTPLKESERYGNSKKLVLMVEADRQCAVRAGLETTFARGVLLALTALTDEQLSADVYIAVAPSDDPKVIFSNVYTVKGARVKTEWDKTADLPSLVRGLQRRLGQAVDDDERGNGNSAPAQSAQQKGAKPADPSARSMSDLVMPKQLGTIRALERECQLAENVAAQKLFNLDNDALSREAATYLIGKLEQKKEKIKNGAS